MKFAVFTTLMSFALFTGSHAFAHEAKDLKGYWAMKPLANGMANVGYFDGEGKSILYPFSCHFDSKTVTSDEEPEQADYQVMDNMIHLSYPELGEELSQVLSIKQLEQNSLTLEQELLPEVTLTYEYQRVDGIKNLCPTQ